MSVASNPSEPRRRVLIVDDEEGFRDGVADLLHMEGYAVSVARNAVEAVPMLPDFRPDVILLDLRMPLLDGEAFLRGIRGLPASRDVPVVLISAKEELPAIALQCGLLLVVQLRTRRSQTLSAVEQVSDDLRRCQSTARGLRRWGRWGCPAACRSDQTL